MLDAGRAPPGAGCVERHRPRRLPAATTVHELFQAQVEWTPDAMAVVSGGTTLTYAGLNGRANRLARLLVSQGAGPESLVAVLMDRSADLVVTLLAVLKAGAAYLPLDPGYPAERLAFMLADSRAEVRSAVVERNQLKARFRCGGCACAGRRRPDGLARRSGRGGGLAGRPGTPPQVAVAPGQLAYVIYTSGSTGIPKGVQATHGSLVNYVLALADARCPDAARV